MAKKNIITNKSEKFLEGYLNNPSPTGFESEGQKMWLSYIKPYIDTHFVDIYGTVVGVINPKAKYKVVIEAHADEISWFVHYITKDGFIYLRRNGGSDHQIAPSKRVNIHTKKGMVKAVFGWPAIHTRTAANEKSPTLDNIFLDCGANDKEEVEKLGIHVGCVVTYEDEFMVLNDKYYVGRALDNRIGGFMIAEVARLLHKNKVKLPFGLYITNSIQEEFRTFSKYIWGFVDEKPIQNNFISLSELPANTALSDKISADLKKRGFKFVGSTIIYAHMQAMGIVNDHTTDCFRHKEVFISNT